MQLMDYLLNHHQIQITMWTRRVQKTILPLWDGIKEEKVTGVTKAKTKVKTRAKARKDTKTEKEKTMERTMEHAETPIQEKGEAVMQHDLGLRPDTTESSSMTTNTWSLPEASRTLRKLDGVLENATRYPNGWTKNIEKVA